MKIKPAGVVSHDVYHFRAERTRYNWRGAGQADTKILVFFVSSCNEQKYIVPECECDIKCIPFSTVIWRWCPSMSVAINCSLYGLASPIVVVVVMLATLLQLNGLSFVGVDDNRIE